MSTSTPDTAAAAREASRSIWVFTPSRTAAADLEAILVQRHELLKDAVERVRESALTDHKHHLLFVGPRGCGKTHLVTLIVSRISADAEASQHLRLAWLNEDETCTSLLELLIKVHTALEKRYADEFRAADLAEAYELKPAAALDFVTKRLLGTLGSKTLVIVTENLDALFDSMGQEGQKQLRAFIQEHPQFAIVATAQRLVEDLSDRTSPFFGFFQTEHLKPLSVEQATTLLQNIARLQGKPEVTEFLATSRGRSRVRALHHLSGGNHRIYIVLSQFITRETLDALIGPFLKMVDELTPYYQERVRWLPPLQRKIVEMLCTCETTVPVKEIARRLFSTPQTISSQLQDLREKGYVESSQRGRESLYEISEPLMRICVEVKENQNTQPLRLLVDFLRVWYDDVELQRRLELCQPESSAFRYLSEALERNDKEGNLRRKMLAREVFGTKVAMYSAAAWKELEANIPEEVLLAMSCMNEGDFEGAITFVAEALKSTAHPTVRANIIGYRGFLESQHGDLSAAIADFTSVIKSPDARADQIAVALLNRGAAYNQRGDNTSAIADWTHAIDFPLIQSGELAKALFNRAVIYDQQGDATGAIADYTRLVEMPDAPSDELFMALTNRAVLQGCRGQNSSAIMDLTRVIESSAAQHDQIVMARLNRGNRYLVVGNNTAAIADFDLIIQQQKTPLDMLVNALFGRAIAHGRCENYTEAIADLNRLIELPEVAPKRAVAARMTLAELNLQIGKGSDSFSAVQAALNLGATQSPPHFEAPVNVIGVLFTAGLNQEGRRSHASTLYALYAKYSATVVLGEALVKHLGSLFAKGEPWPSSDNLDQWLTAWEQAAGDAPDFKLPLRLLRIGIEFIKSGGKDQSILLTLTSPERSLLRQALGLDRSEN